jgi:L-threonylcarbamoyladenylate synthase
LRTQVFPILPLSGKDFFYPDIVSAMTPSSKILEANEINLNACAQLLCNGDVIGVPTETVYGLAGNALNEGSVRKIFEVKGRPLIDPLIVHFIDLVAAETHIVSNPTVRRLATAFWPGPLTMVVPKKNTIPYLVTAGLPSVAIRVPQHPIFRQLLQRLNFPLAAPSANPFGYVSPTLASHVEQTLGNRIKAVLDGGPCDFGIESTIIDLRNPSQPRILRHGPITQEQISELLQIKVESGIAPTNEVEAQAAPGLLTKHYSPNAKVVLLEHGCTIGALSKAQPSAQTALLLNQKPTANQISHDIYWLSESGSLAEIAHNLFDLIQRLDRLEYLTILIEQAPNQGIGQAINDRLSRAAAKR